ncbi:MAG: polysaccharide biosynthesis/export family protein [Syntrophaceae bacterium]|nr:polysaccharide biosynthesis/export family protein [Syntrophaceae bacterium]
MKRKKIKFKSEFYSYAVYLLLIITFLLPVGCSTESSHIKWNPESKRFETVHTAWDKTGAVKEIDVSTAPSTQAGTTPVSVPQEGSPVVQVENVTIPPLEEPAPDPDYIVGPNDIIIIDVIGAPEYSSIFSSTSVFRGSRVDGSGYIQMPTLGLVKVGGLTVSQIREHIQNLLKQYINEPSVVVEVTEYKSSPLYILGQFKNTGVFYMNQPFNVMQGLALGGGYDAASANPRAARIIRDKRVLPVDVYELLMNADQTQNVWLKPGDTIFMPDNKNQMVFVFGAGNIGMSIPLPTSGMNILQAIATAGMQKVGYHSRQAYLIRSLSPTRGQLMIVDIDAITEGDALPLKLCEGDVIYIPKSGMTSWNEALSEILPTLQAFGAILTPFVQLKYLFD